MNATDILGGHLMRGEAPARPANPTYPAPEVAALINRAERQLAGKRPEDIRKAVGKIQRGGKIIELGERPEHTLLKAYLQVLDQGVRPYRYDPSECGAFLERLGKLVEKFMPEQERDRWVREPPVCVGARLSLVGGALDALSRVLRM